MKILVLDSSKRKFDLIKKLHEDEEVVHVHRYLQFLHSLETDAWDMIYLSDYFSDIKDPDLWMDGNGFEKFFDGTHAARTIASLAEIGNCPTKKVIISSNSILADKMFQILTRSNVKVHLIA